MEEPGTEDMATQMTRGNRRAIDDPGLRELKLLSALLNGWREHMSYRRRAHGGGFAFSSGTSGCAGRAEHRYAQQREEHGWGARSNLKFRSPR